MTSSGKQPVASVRVARDDGLRARLNDKVARRYVDLLDDLRGDPPHTRRPPIGLG
jgi:hypothetical protein